MNKSRKTKQSQEDLGDLRSIEERRSGKLISLEEVKNRCNEKRLKQLQPPAPTTKP